MKFNWQAVKAWFDPAQYSVATKNWAKGLTATALLATGAGSLAYLVGGISALYSTLAINAGMSFLTAWYSREIVFWLYSIKPVQKGELVEGFDLHKMVEEIVSHPEIGCSMPALGIHETDNLNAFATGRHKGHAGVAVTRGLLKEANKYAEKTKFTPEALVKGVLFHELGHVSNHDVAIQSSISILSLLFTKLCHLAYEKVINTPEKTQTEKTQSEKEKNKQSNQVEKKLSSKFLVPLVFVLGWTGSTLSNLLQKWFSRTRETCADEMAFKCGYGPQLAAALKMLEEGSKGCSTPHKEPSTQHFFGNDSFESALFCHHNHAHEEKKSDNGLVTWAFKAFASHPTVEDRVEHLKILESEKATKFKTH